MAGEWLWALHVSISRTDPVPIQKIEAGKLNVLATTLARLQVALKCDWDKLMG
jgi:hypothetical protein